MGFPQEVQGVIDKLKLETSTISIWFIGSRANGNFRMNSDWDLICFRNSLVEVQEARSEVVDVIQVGNDARYLLEGQFSDLIGEFRNWQWNDIDSKHAQYKSRVTPVVEIGNAYNLADVKLVTYNAYRIWSQNA